MEFYDPKKGLSTYNTGIIQAKAYRAMRITLTSGLKKYGLSMSEWALLGTIYDKKFVKYSELADLLEVKAPLITKIVDGLIDKELVSSIKDKDDKRSKLLTVTPKALGLIPTIEKEVKERTKNLISDITHPELLIYVKVLHSLASNLKEVK
ncbi:MAG: MarR family transcriptional regulator [Candidatus Dojkabacteria bacterium]